MVKFGKFAIGAPQLLGWLRLPNAKVTSSQYGIYQLEAAVKAVVDEC